MEHFNELKARHRACFALLTENLATEASYLHSLAATPGTTSEAYSMSMKSIKYWIYTIERELECMSALAKDYAKLPVLVNMLKSLETAMGPQDGAAASVETGC